MLCPRAGGLGAGQRPGRNSWSRFRGRPEWALGRSANGTGYLGNLRGRDHGRSASPACCNRQQLRLQIARDGTVFGSRPGGVVGHHTTGLPVPGEHHIGGRRAPAGQLRRQPDPSRVRGHPPRLRRRAAAARRLARRTRRRAPSGTETYGPAWRNCDAGPAQRKTASRNGQSARRPGTVESRRTRPSLAANRSSGTADSPSSMSLACWPQATRRRSCCRATLGWNLTCGTRAGRHRDRRGPTRAYPPAGRQATIGRGERSGSRYCIQSVMSCRRRSNRSLRAYAASVWLRTTCASAASTTSRG